MHDGFNEKESISSAVAGKILGYTPDYIGKLCREGELVCKRVGRDWYVDASSVEAFRRKVEEKKEKRRKQLAQERAAAFQREATPVIPEPALSAPSPVPVAAQIPTPHFPDPSSALVVHVNISFPHVSRKSVVTSLVLCLVLFAGISFAAVDPLRASVAQGVRNLSSSVSGVRTAFGEMKDGVSEGIKNVSETFSVFPAAVSEATEGAKRKAEDAAAIFPAAFAEMEVGIGEMIRKGRHAFVRARSSLGSFFTAHRTISSANDVAIIAASNAPKPFIISSQIAGKPVTTVSAAMLAGDSMPIPRIRSAQIGERAVSAAPERSNAAASSEPRTVVERIIERAVASGLTAAYVDQKLEELDNKLSSKIYNISAQTGGNTTRIVEQTTVIAQSSRIDDLSSVDISQSTFANGTITGSSFSGSSGTFSGTLSVTGTGSFGSLGVGTSSPAWKLSVAGTGSFDDYVRASYFTATSTTATSTFAGGLAVETSGFVYDYSSNRVGIGTAAPSNALSVSGTTNITNRLGVGTTSPFAKLSVAGTGSFDDYVRASYFTATSTTASTFPYASSTAFTASGTGYFNRIGIATSSPYRTLSVVGSGVFTGGNVLASTFTGTSTVTGATFVGTSATATSTLAGGLAIETSGFVYDYSTGRVGIGPAPPSQALTVSGNGYITGGFGVGIATTTAGVFETSSNAYVGGNLTVVGNSVVLGNSTTIGGNTADSLTINSSINSNLIPDLNATRDIGSPSFYWDDGFFDTITANNLSAASTTISGTQAATFTINSDNASADTESADLIFYRGSVVPNALLSWDATNNRFDFNQPLFIQNDDTSTVGNVTLDIKGSSGQTGNIFRVASSTGVSYLSILPNGNVGIGNTNSSQKLNVQGTVAAQIFTATSTTATSTFAGGLAIETSGLVYDYSSNRVGIGTAAPAYTLDVTGTGRFTGALTLGTALGIANGGTNASSFGTSNGVVYYNGTSLVNAAGLTFDGTKLTATYASSTAFTASGTGYFNQIGVATTSPYRTLSVVGSGVFTGGNVLASTFTGTSTVTGATFVGTSATATSTLAGGLAIETSGFVYDYSTGRVGIGTATTTAGVFETSSNAYVGGNLTVVGNSVVLGNSTTIGGNTADSLTINSSINSNLIPDLNATRDIGSPSFYWDDGFFDTITANNLSAASTTISGTQAA